jgi:hypothetical protein
MHDSEDNNRKDAAEVDVGQATRDELLQQVSGCNGYCGTRQALYQTQPKVPLHFVNRQYMAMRDNAITCQSDQNILQRVFRSESTAQRYPSFGTSLLQFIKESTVLDFYGFSLFPFLVHNLMSP